MEAEPPVIPPKRKRRWFQFSLRTLLIFMLVVAIPCGWLGRKMERKRREREAVTAIEKAGGWVIYDDQVGATIAGSGIGPIPHERPGPAWLRAILGDDFFASEVNAIGITNTPNVSPVTALLPTFPDIKRLCLSETRAGDADLAHVDGLGRLEELDLGWTKVGDEGLVNVEHLKELRVLSLGKTNVTDVGLAHLKKLKQLRHLYIGKTKVTDAGLSDLRAALPDCEIHH